MSKSSSFINSQLSIAIFDQDVMKEVGRTFIFLLFYIFAKYACACKTAVLKDSF